MNYEMLLGLKGVESHVKIIRYKDIKNMKQVFRSYGLPTPPSGLDDSLLQGDRIHYDKPLRTSSTKVCLADNIRERIPASVWKRVPSLAPRRTGSLCAHSYDLSYRSSGDEKSMPSLKLKLQEHAFLDTLQSKISSKMKHLFGIGLNEQKQY
jgi:hypothetical protein